MLKNLRQWYKWNAPDWMQLYWIRNTYNNIKRVLRWLPTIWNDRDWDSHYLLRIMRFKLERMRLNMQANCRHVGWEKTVKEIRLAELLIGRLLGDYEDLEDIDGSNAIFKEHCSCIPRNDENIFGRSCKNCFRQWKLKNQQEKDTRKLLFKHMARQMDKWWD